MAQRRFSCVINSSLVDDHLRVPLWDGTGLELMVDRDRALGHKICLKNSNHILKTL